MALEGEYFEHCAKHMIRGSVSLGEVLNQTNRADEGQRCEMKKQGGGEINTYPGTIGKAWNRIKPFKPKHSGVLLQVCL